ncbi:hypothetical protein QY95_03211 [Bacillus thermotolerans]|uniref:Uncharacterized protein n=1 Tax=Bacillus thermotolerans TaxID=1221996 RepID=A0A0F5HU11_BACTR|nr:hypothetical protein QY95_03211 [Bacillus thermotolerans]
MFIDLCHFFLYNLSCFPLNFYFPPLLVYFYRNSVYLEEKVVKMDK